MPGVVIFRNHRKIGFGNLERKKGKDCAIIGKGKDCASIIILLLCSFKILYTFSILL